MMHFFKDREDAARFVSSRIRRWAGASQLTITIEPEKSGACCVSLVTSSLSDDTQTPNSSKGLDVT